MEIFVCYQQNTSFIPNKEIISKSTQRYTCVLLLYMDVTYGMVLNIAYDFRTYSINCNTFGSKHFIV